MYTQKKKYSNVLIREIFWRHGQVVRQGIANPLSPVQIWVPPNSERGCGGMVDTTDLKSVDYYGREGSSPSTPSHFY